MKFLKGITFRLFAILSVFLISFICIIIYLQIFVIGRSYMVTQHSQARELELRDELISSFIGDYEGIFDNEDVYSIPYRREAVMNLLEDFSNRNNADAMILDSNANIKYVLGNTINLLKQPLLNNISSSIKSNSEARKKEVFIRLYDRFNLPTEYIAFSLPVYVHNGEMQYIVVVLKDVFTDNSSGLLKGYIFYALMASIIITLIITGILSYIITRPIIKINNTALKMIDMDFSARCEVKSSSEMGTLASSLNFLSDKLSNTIKRLKFANDKLQKDLDVQKELDLLRKEFIAGISHEFKTPITIIKGYTEGIIDDVMSPEEKEEAYRIIISETSKMDHLVQGLLDLSTMEAPNYNLNLSDVIIQDLINSIVKKYTFIMKEKEIYFIVSADCGNAMVNIDAFRIEQVITNFINNAIANTNKYNKIYLSAETVHEGIQISVENEGAHIGQDHISRIWEKFYRIDKSRSKKSGGTGLGLAITKIILELHGSSYGVTNTEKGVKFYFILKKLVSK